VTIKHIIFDCDGVLVDSEPLSMRADVTLLRQFGITLSEQEAHHRFVGKTFEAMLIEMQREHGVEFPVGLSAEKDRVLEDLFRSDLKPVAEMRSTLDQLKLRGLTFSVASNSPKARVALALQLTGLQSFFNEITTFEEVKYGKPEPDVFLRAREKTAIDAASCLVVEDSLTGVSAAVAARLRTIGFTGTHDTPDTHAQRLTQAGAAAIIHRMADLLLFI
jgi:HAD superfamily hydrolase (TIGR01509 family)